MAILLYCGDSGSGKSYQAVKEVIIPALFAGRTVYTSIRGVNLKLIQEYAIELGKIPPSDDSLIVFSGDKVEKPLFYPVYDKENETFDDSNSFIKKGVLLIIDEAARYFRTARQFSPASLLYFNEHRHAVNPDTGQTTDIVLLTPAIAELNKLIRDKAENTFICRKHKELGGAKAKSYVVAQYSKCDIRGKAIKKDIKFYDKRFFEFYKSYAGDKSGSEELVDARQHVFSMDFFVKKGIMIIAFIVIGAILAYMWYSKTIASSSKFSKSKDQPLSQPSQEKQPPSLPPQPKPFSSDTKRIMSVLIGKNHTFVYIQSQTGKVDILINPSSLALVGQHSSVLVDGERITDSWGKSTQSEHVKAPL